MEMQEPDLQQVMARLESLEGRQRNIYRVSSLLIILWLLATVMSIFKTSSDRILRGRAVSLSADGGSAGAALAASNEGGSLFLRDPNGTVRVMLLAEDRMPVLMLFDKSGKEIYRVPECCDAR